MQRSTGHARAESARTPALGLTLNTCSQLGQTMLHSAAIEGDGYKAVGVNPCHVMQKLLDMGADIEARDNAVSPHHPPAALANLLEA